MTETGLNKREQDLINEVFLSDDRIEKVVIFGSRANGKFKHNSDIDFAVYGIEDNLQIEMVRMALDDLPLPYKFDVIGHGSIQYKPLLEHIKNVGKVFYCKGGEG